MEERIMTDEMLRQFARCLREAERSGHTCEKYLRDAARFASWTGKRPVTKELLLEWRESLLETGYTAASVNSMLAAVAALLRCLGWTDCRVHRLRTQRRVYCPRERELSKAEYDRLLAAAERKPRLRLVLETLGSTGIRVSELRYFTVEGAKAGELYVSCKGKTRTILLPGKLRKKLLRYAAAEGIRSGPIFRTRSGNPLDRSNIWSALKALAREAGVDPRKVFPHNFRHLFARLFFRQEKDIAMLADVLGHSSVETTRIYLLRSGEEHRKSLDRLRLIS